MASADRTHQPHPPPLLLQTESLVCGFSAGLGPVVRSPELRLASGEALAVVGPNGAGKSTLLRTLAGQLRPLEGKVRVQGQDLHAMVLDHRARAVSLLGQNDRSDGSLTVKELVELGRTPHLGLWGHLGVSDREAVERALVAARVEDLAGRRLDQISGGERQRARIALTLAQEAPLLLLDEAVNHLDLRNRFEHYALLARLRQERGLTVVLVLHDLAEAFRESDRVMLLGRGEAEILGAGDPHRVQRLARAFGVPEEWITGV